MVRFSLFVVVVLALCGVSSAQCYTDPLTGLTVCQQPTRATPIANVVKAQPVRSAVRGVYQSVSNVKASGNCTGSQSYGSTGKAAVSYGSNGSSVTYGSTGSSVSYSGPQVGRYFNGELVVAVGEPKPVVAPAVVAEPKIERPVAAPVKASCPCGVDCKCGPNCDCNESKKQVFIRKEDFEQMPLI
jgi:hypothetical protein